jgi:hypothetical protein
MRFLVISSRQETWSAKRRVLKTNLTIQQRLKRSTCKPRTKVFNSRERQPPPNLGAYEDFGRKM